MEAPAILSVLFLFAVCMLLLNLGTRNPGSVARKSYTEHQTPYSDDFSYLNYYDPVPLWSQFGLYSYHKFQERQMYYKGLRQGFLAAVVVILSLTVIALVTLDGPFYVAADEKPAMAGR